MIVMEWLIYGGATIVTIAVFAIILEETKITP